jgi:hypothetical protein
MSLGYLRPVEHGAGELVEIPLVSRLLPSQSSGHSVQDIRLPQVLIIDLGSARTTILTL